MVVVLLLAGLLAYMYWPTGPVKIRISRETTYIDGPVNPDGTVNYVAYLDAKCSEGVTPENNAAPLLLRAFGSHVFPAGAMGETLRRLDLPADFLDNDKHFIMWGNRTRTGKVRATMPSQPNELEQADDEDDGPSLNEVFDMLLAGQVHPDLENWLTANASPLDLIRQASAKERYYLPIVTKSKPSSMTEALVPCCQHYSYATKALAMRAILKMTPNEARGAWDDVLAAHRLARLLDQAPNLIEQLVAVGIEEMAARAGTVLATRGHLPPEEAREILGKLAALEPVGRIVEVIDTSERFFALDVVIMLSRPGKLRANYQFLTGQTLLGNPDLDWNQMLRDLNIHYDGMVKPLRLPRFQGREKAQEANEKKFEQMEADLKDHPPTGLRMFLLSNGGRPFRRARTTVMTHLLMSILVPTLEQAGLLEDRGKMTHEIETLAVALACHHAEKGHWPGELKELCPALLKAIPADRFSGKGLVYRPSKDGYLLYSIGKNMRDDGGQCQPRDSGTLAGQRTDDIVAKVEPAGAASRPATSQP